MNLANDKSTTSATVVPFATTGFSKCPTGGITLQAPAGFTSAVYNFDVCDVAIASGYAFLSWAPVTGYIYTVGVTKQVENAYKIGDFSFTPVPCAFDITVLPSTATPPVSPAGTGFTACPTAPITTAPASTSAVYNFDISDVKIDAANCYTFKSWSPVTGYVYPVGTTTQTETVTKGGIDYKCTFDIIVPPLNPWPKCPTSDITLNLAPGYSAVYYNGYTGVALYTTDPSPGITQLTSPAGIQQYDPISGWYYCPGTTTQVKDYVIVGGVKTLCSFKVIVPDVPAFKKCPADITIQSTNGVNAVYNYDALGDELVNYPAYYFGYWDLPTPLNGWIFPIGKTQVSNHAFKTCGATTTQYPCAFKVTVTPPPANPAWTNCPKDVTVNANAGTYQIYSGTSAIYNYDILTNPDREVVAPGYYFGGWNPANGYVFPVGTTKVSNWDYKIGDATFTKYYCNFTVTVPGPSVATPVAGNVTGPNGTTTPAPALTCPANVTVNATNGVSATYDVVSAVSSVNFPNYLYNSTDAPAGFVFPVGGPTAYKTFYTLVGDAVPGTLYACNFTVKVLGCTDVPVIPATACPKDFTVTLTPNECSHASNYIVPTAATPSAACAAYTPSVTKLAGPLPTDLLDLAGSPYTVTYGVSSTSGLSGAPCSFKITVVPTQASNISISNAGNLCSGGYAYLSANGTTNNSSALYAWQYKAAGAASFVNVTAPTALTTGGLIRYTSPLLSTANTGDQYRIAVTTPNTMACQATVYSAPFTLNVLDCYVPIGFHTYPKGLPACSQNAFRSLEVVFNTLNGANWYNNSGWFTDSNMNNWYGVTMTSDGCDVLSIKLPKNLRIRNVMGVLCVVGMPQSFLGTLNQLSFPKLETLDLSGNNISFQIYDYNFPNLKVLNLSNNNLSSCVPTLSALPSLQELYLNDNQLMGDVPASIFKLKKYDLRNNRFTFTNLSNAIGSPTESAAYAPQALISLDVRDNALVANTGSNNNANGKEQYTWLNNGNVVTTTTSNGFVPTTEGTYSVAVSHSDLTKVTDANMDLVLQSNSIDVTPATLETLRAVSVYSNKALGINATYNVSPNPVSNIVHIQFSKFDKAVSILKIYDLSGKTVLNQTINTFDTPINVSSFVNGSYIVEISSNGEMFREKLVKE